MCQTVKALIDTRWWSSQQGVAQFVCNTLVSSRINAAMRSFEIRVEL
jgi:hypothetical protein